MPGSDPVINATENRTGIFPCDFVCYQTASAGEQHPTGVRPRAYSVQCLTPPQTLPTGVGPQYVHVVTLRTFCWHTCADFGEVGLLAITIDQGLTPTQFAELDRGRTPVLSCCDAAHFLLAHMCRLRRSRPTRNHDRSGSDPDSIR